MPTKAADRSTVVTRLELLEQQTQAVLEEEQMNEQSQDTTVRVSRLLERLAPTHEGWPGQSKPTSRPLYSQIAAKMHVESQGIKVKGESSSSRDSSTLCRADCAARNSKEDEKRRRKTEKQRLARQTKRAEKRATEKLRAELISYSALPKPSAGNMGQIG